MPLQNPLVKSDADLTIEQKGTNSKQIQSLTEMASELASKNQIQCDTETNQMQFVSDPNMKQIQLAKGGFCSQRKTTSSQKNYPQPSVAPKVKPNQYAALLKRKDPNSIFIRKMLEVTNSENFRIEEIRSRIHWLQERTVFKEELGCQDRRWLNDLSKEYGVNYNEDIDELFQHLLERVDIVPASIVIAQAIDESAWGTSRFARLGHNYFGQHCHSPGCGIRPLNSKSKKSRGMMIFSSMGEAVSYYIHAMNTSEQFPEFRHIRATQRAQGQTPSGSALLESVKAYSESGWEHIRKLRVFINKNNLYAYD
ncbi:MAG: glucosaminidase domain-containing protein [Magnetococcus sp. DMHC-6]